VPAVEAREKPVAGGVQLFSAEVIKFAADERVMRAISSRHRRSPSSAALSVEPTMSVKSSVASLRSGSTSACDRLTNRLISSSARSVSPSQAKWSTPGKLHAAGVRDAIGDVAAVLHVDQPVAGPLEDQGRRGDRR
jgi:hypothetical protein